MPKETSTLTQLGPKGAVELEEKDCCFRSRVNNEVRSKVATLVWGGGTGQWLRDSQWWRKESRVCALSAPSRRERPPFVSPSVLILSISSKLHRNWSYSFSSLPESDFSIMADSDETRECLGRIGRPREGQFLHSREIQELADGTCVASPSLRLSHNAVSIHNTM